MLLPTHTWTIMAKLPNEPGGENRPLGVDSRKDPYDGAWRDVIVVETRTPLYKLLQSGFLEDAGDASLARHRFLAGKRYGEIVERASMAPNASIDTTAERVDTSRTNYSHSHTQLSAINQMERMARALTPEQNHLLWSLIVNEVPYTKLADAKYGSSGQSARKRIASDISVALDALVELAGVARGRAK